MSWRGQFVTMSPVRWSPVTGRLGVGHLLAGVLLVLEASALDLRPRASIGPSKKSLRPDAVPIIEGQEPVDSVIIKAVEIPEERVTYEGAQLWRVLAEGEHAEFVSYLQETGGKIHACFIGYRFFVIVGAK